MMKKTVSLSKESLDSQQTYDMYGFMNIHEMPEIRDTRLTRQTKSKTFYDFRIRKVKAKTQTDIRQNWRLSRLEEEKIKRQQQLEEVEKYKNQARTWASVDRQCLAVQMYTKALDIAENDIECLMGRAACHFALSDYCHAIQDADAVLKLDTTVAKAHYIKAEASYLQGEFEIALIHYHRAHRLRPGLPEHAQGIRKATRAIENSIGDSSGLKLEKSGDLSFFSQQTNMDQNESLDTGKDKTPKPNLQVGLQHNAIRPKKSHCVKTVKQLLGELYGDWKYLENILNNEENYLKNLHEHDTDDVYMQSDEKRRECITDSTFHKKQFSMKLRDLASEELRYLEKRSEFWRQHKHPVPDQSDESSGVKNVEKLNKLVQLLGEIEEDQCEKRYGDSLLKAGKAMTLVTSLGGVLADRYNYEASLNSLMGNTYFEKKQYEKALEHYNKDLEIAQKQNLEGAKSRALENIGRLYVKTGKYMKAIKVFEQRVKVAENALELAWLHHELGRCYMEKGRHAKALENGETSLKNAQLMEDNAWCLNANALIAQAYVHMGEFEAALEVFERALDIAKVEEDREAQAAINRAIKDLHDRSNTRNRTITASQESVEEEDVNKGGNKDESCKSPKEIQHLILNATRKLSDTSDKPDGNQDDDVSEPMSDQKGASNDWSQEHFKKCEENDRPRESEEQEVPHSNCNTAQNELNVHKKEAETKQSESETRESKNEAIPTAAEIASMIKEHDANKNSEREPPSAQDIQDSDKNEKGSESSTRSSTPKGPTINMKSAEKQGKLDSKRTPSSYTMQSKNPEAEDDPSVHGAAESKEGPGSEGEGENEPSVHDIVAEIKAANERLEERERAKADAIVEDDFYD